MPKDRLAKAQQFGDRLAQGLGNNLVAVAAFGSFIRGGYTEAHANLNVLVIAKDASTEALKPVEPAIAEWVKHGGEPPLIFSESGWHASPEVFPIEIEEMREAYKLLEGSDPFDGVVTNREDIRRQLEREVRSKLLRLRAVYASVAPDGKALSKLLADSANTVMVLVRATLRLVKKKPPPGLPSQVHEAAAVAGFDATAFDWSVAELSGKRVEGLDAYDPLAARYLQAVEQLAEYVNQA